MQETLTPHLARRAAPGQPRSTSSGRSRWPTGSAATSCRATSTAPGVVLARTPGEHWEVVRVSLPAALARYVVEKGSITVDGVSLTVVEVGPDWFTVSLIPTTLAVTTLGRNAGRRHRQPRGRRDRQVRREAGCGGADSDRDSGMSALPTAPDTADGGVRLDAIRTPSPRSRAGRAVVVVDDEDRENEGDLIFAASEGDARAGRLHDPPHLRRHLRADAGAGPRPARAAADDARQRGPAAAPRTRSRSTPATASTTGISAADRAHTIRVLADSATEPYELTRPGHVFPLRGRRRRRAAPAGHTEAAVDLAAAGRAHARPA